MRYDRSWPTAAVPHLRRKLPLEMRAVRANGGLRVSLRTHTFGQLQPSTPKENRAGNDRSQGTADVARRRTRNEKIYKAGARRSVIIAAQNTDRRAAVSEIELALSTRCCLSLCPKAAIRNRKNGHYDLVSIRRAARTVKAASIGAIWRLQSHFSGVTPVVQMDEERGSILGSIGIAN